MNQLRRLIVYLNMWRIAPVYLFWNTNRFRVKCRMDLEQWIQFFPHIATEKKIFQLGYTLLNDKVCRNVLLNRLHRNPIMYAITRVFFKPLESCYINMPPEKIGGGLSFQHGFSTILTATEIGERCKINQQVTIGYNGTEAPTIGNDVEIMAGAIVIGGVHIADGAKVGAGAVVTKDVPEHTVVAGVPARVLRTIND